MSEECSKHPPTLQAAIAAKSYFLRPILIRHNQPMADPKGARDYLAETLGKAGITPKQASDALGMNHAYFQQYLRYGKPRYLPERVRQGLVEIVPALEEDRLKPPPRRLRHKPIRESQNKRQVNPPTYAEIMDDPGFLELLRLWGAIDQDRRAMALRILRVMADTESPSSVVA